MESEENQNVENTTTEENLVSAEPKQETVDSVVENPEIIKSEVFSPVTEIINGEPKETPPVEQVETEVVEPIIESATETPIIGTTETTEQIETQKTEEIPQTEIPPVQEVQSQPQTQIIYQTPPNLIQNLLNKARAKIQERKRNKLDKIMLLFESNQNISNSDVQELLRTTKRSATRYLNILEKEQKIIQVGNAGRGVKYIKKP